MIEVYYESQSHAELIATFEDEETYNKCVPILEQDAKENGMFLTEKIHDNE